MRKKNIASAGGSCSGRKSTDAEDDAKLKAALEKDLKSSSATA